MLFQMSNVKTFRKTGRDTGHLPSVGRRAEENLEYIRSTIEGGMQFTSVPGYGGVLMGISAIAASIFAFRADDFYSWLIIWSIEAVIAITIGALALWRKAIQNGENLFSISARKFSLCFVPSIIVAAILTLLLMRYENRSIIALLWVALYGVAVASGGAFSVKPVQAMGWSFIAAAIMFSIKVLWNPMVQADLIMAVCFGFLHIIFGIFIAKKYGG